MGFAHTKGMELPWDDDCAESWLRQQGNCIDFPSMHTVKIKNVEQFAKYFEGMDSRKGSQTRKPEKEARKGSQKRKPEKEARKGSQKRKPEKEARKGSQKRKPEMEA